MMSHGIRRGLFILQKLLDLYVAFPVFTLGLNFNMNVISCEWDKAFIMSLNPIIFSS